MACEILILTYSPLIAGSSKLSLEERVCKAINTCAKEIMVTGLGGRGGPVAVKERPPGAASSACQLKDMAAAARKFRWEKNSIGSTESQLR